MITFFSNKINNLNELLQKFPNDDKLNNLNIQEYMPTFQDVNGCKCPKCNRQINTFVHYGTYTRNLSFILNNEVINTKVVVTRVKCKGCNSTHAILPCFIVPYKIMASPSIINIVSATTKVTVLLIAEKFKISYQIIYIYLNLVHSFFVDTSMVSKKYLNQNFNEQYLKTNIATIANADFKKSFFSYHKWIYLMTKYRNCKPPPVYLQAS